MHTQQPQQQHVNQQQHPTDSDGTASGPPPLPIRPDQQGANGQLNRTGYGNGNGMYAGMSPYGNSFSSPYSMGMGMGSYGGYGGGYGGSYGGYGGMSRFGMPGYPSANGGDQNDFVRLAEESSRNAFQSIESIVQAFGSVSMMLESTYFAVHSSFRAVLGVADHFTRLRSHFAQIISTLAVVRTVQWFVRRLAFLMGLSPNDPNDEALWRDAAIKASEFPLTPEGVLDALTREDVSKGKSSWPILIFFAVVMGTPWLIWKLLAKISGSNDDAKNKRWMRGESDHYLASGAYDFVAQSPKEVSFSTGQQIIVAPKGNHKTKLLID